MRGELCVAGVHLHSKGITSGILEPADAGVTTQRVIMSASSTLSSPSQIRRRLLRFALIKE